MKKNVVRKGLVIGIILLFFGICIYPTTVSISRNFNIINIEVSSNKLNSQNNPPIINRTFPTDSATNIPISGIPINAEIYDSDDDDLWVEIWSNYTGEWIEYASYDVFMQSERSILYNASSLILVDFDGDGEWKILDAVWILGREGWGQSGDWGFMYNISVTNDWGMTKYGRTYYWSVNVTDNSTWTNETYHFSTKTVVVDVAYVDDDFNESTPGWGYDHFDKIQDGIDSVNESGTVYVYNGTYYENLVVNKSITLIGEDKNTTIIDGTGTGDVLHLSANNISIKWFTIKNGGNWTRDAGIDIRSNSVLIKSNILIDNRVGIYLDNAEYNVIMDNIIVNSSEYGYYSGHGIWLSHSSNNNTVTNNTISNGDYHGIAIAYSRDNNISQNTIMNNEEGINLYEAANNILYLNDITNHSRCAIRIIYSGNDSIIGNNIVDNGDYGIEILGSNRTTIYGNIILNNNYQGINIEYSFDIYVIKNTIIDCYRGIHVDDSSNLTINKNYIKNCTSNGISIYGSMWNGIGHVISENTMTYNGDEGLMLACDTPHNIISGNTFISNHPGITIGRDTYDNIIFENNLIDNYDYGILILPTAKTNYIYHNNFINNSKHAYGGTHNIWDDDYPSGGNYWDNYTGTDTNGDGIGDTPYYVPVDNEDHYPFMEPSGWDKNYPPYMINLSGPEYGKPGIEYHYLAKFYDINSDSFYCMFDWGDESYSAWLGPYHSGEAIHAHHAWINGVYSIKVKAKDILGAEGEWSDPLELHIEDDDPQVKITKPVKALYIMNRKILPRFFRRTLILGTIDITVDAIDDSGIEKVEFYIDNKLKSIDNSSPYSYTWTRDRLRFIHLHVIKVITYDNAGNMASDKILVRKFF